MTGACQTVPPLFDLGSDPRDGSTWIGIECDKGTLNHGYPLLLTREQEALRIACEEQVRKLQSLDVLYEHEGEYEFVQEAPGIELSELKQHFHSNEDKDVSRCCLLKLVQNMGSLVQLKHQIAAYSKCIHIQLCPSRKDAPTSRLHQ